MIATDEVDPLTPKILAKAPGAQGKTQEALAAYQSLADRGSSQPEDLIPYAMLLLRQGQWAKALAAYEKALPFVAEGGPLRQGNDFSADVPQPVALEAVLHVAHPR